MLQKLEEEAAWPSGLTCRTRRNPAVPGSSPALTTTWIHLPGFTGCRFFVAFPRDTLPKQVSLLAGYCLLGPTSTCAINAAEGR